MNPQGSLDNKLRDEFLDLLIENFRNRHVTVLLITHDYSMISQFASSYQDLAKRVFFKELFWIVEDFDLRNFAFGVSGLDR